MIDLTARAHAEVTSHPKRSRTRRTSARKPSALGAAGALLARHPLALVAGLLALAAGFAFYQHSVSRPASQPHIEAPAPPRPAPTPAVAPADIRKDDPLAALLRNNASEAPAAPVKSLPPSRSIVPLRDPALDAWFIKAYLRCWSPPATLPPGEKYAAQIRVAHNADGSLAAAPHLVNPPSDPAWRAFADSAVRAVTKCTPLQAPAQYQAHFDQWRKMTLHFSPDSAAD